MSTNTISQEVIPSTKIEDINLSTRTKNALINANILTINDLSQKTKQEIKNTIGIGKKGFEEIVSLVKLKSNKGQFNLRKYLVDKFLKKHLLINHNKEERDSTWANNIMVASRLLKKYPEEEFWYWFNIDFKLNSLAYFLTAKGEERIVKEYNKWKLNLNWKEKEHKSYKLESEKQGEDTILINKPKTLKDFLNG